MSGELETITYRPASPSDAAKLAEISILAGGGTFELLLQDLKRGVTVLQAMTALCRAANTEYSYNYYTVAEIDNEIVGGVNAVSVEDRHLLAANINPILRSQFKFGIWQLVKFYLRARHLKGMNVLKAPPNTLHINDIAIFPQFQGRGIGKNLVLQVLRAAAAKQMANVSLYVWTDNKPAIEMYQKIGFQVAATATIEPHPKYLPHTGSHLMLYRL